MHTQDQSNNETISRGVTRLPQGLFLALNFGESRTFKTERGAVAWLAKRGINPDGTRQDA